MHFLFRGRVYLNVLTFALDTHSAGGGECYKEVNLHIKSVGAPYNKMKLHALVCNR